MRCPDCSRQKTPTRTLRTIAVDPIVTYVLIAINVLIYIGVELAAARRSAARTSGSIYTDFALRRHGVADGRLVAAGHVRLPALRRSCTSR